jgi:hypothetical protein
MLTQREFKLAVGRGLPEIQLRLLTIQSKARLGIEREVGILEG